MKNVEEKIIKEILHDLSIISYRIDNLNPDENSIKLIHAVDNIEDAKSSLVQFLEYQKKGEDDFCTCNTGGEGNGYESCGICGKQYKDYKSENWIE